MIGHIFISCLALVACLVFLMYQTRRRKLRLFRVSSFRYSSQDKIIPGSYCMPNEERVLIETGQPLRALQGGLYDSRQLIQIARKQPSIVGFVGIRHGEAGPTYYIPLAHDQPSHPVLYQSKACIPTTSFKAGGVHIVYVPVMIDTKLPRNVKL